MQRVLSLDVFRGITIALMILVNSPGNTFIYPSLMHASWDGCTFADLVFPFFIVILGASAVLALTAALARGVSRPDLMLSILKRSLTLFGIGLLLNAFMHNFDLPNLRFLGVLQRIAICYASAAMLFLTTKVRVQVLLMVVLLISYWFVIIFFTGVTVTIENNAVGFLDRWLFSSEHLYTPIFDPEGLLSTLPAIASALFGNLLGVFLISEANPSRKCQGIGLLGVLALVLGFGASFIFPFNKSLWSSSYVLWTAGLAFISFAALYFCIEIKKWQHWSKPFALFGRHALFIYILHIVCLKIQAMIVLSTSHGESMNLKRYLTDALFGTLKPENASLAYAALYTLFCLSVLFCWEKKRAFSCQIIRNKQ